MISEVNQAEKDKCYIISEIYTYIWNLLYMDIYGYIYIWNLLKNGDRTEWSLQEMRADTEKYLKFFILNK